MKLLIYKISFLIIATLLASLAMPITARADGGGEGAETFSQTVNGHQITLVFEKPANLGENPVHMIILDEAGNPVSNADVEVSVEKAEADGHAETESGGHSDEVADEHASAEDAHINQEDPHTMEDEHSPAPETTPTKAIASMSHMAPASSHSAMGMTALKAGHTAGEYEGVVSIKNDGDLVVRAHITMHEEQLEAKFPIHVKKSNTGAVVLGSFLFINVAIVAAALAMKPRTPSANIPGKA